MTKITKPKVLRKSAVQRTGKTQCKSRISSEKGALALFSPLKLKRPQALLVAGIASFIGLSVVIYSMASTTSYSLWPSTTVPKIVADSDTKAVELGVKFSANADGKIAGVKFYKSQTNTGTHTGSLWTSNGRLLAKATFINERSSGWQRVLFSTPVAVKAGQQYVASYHTNVGHYSADNDYFAKARVNGPLTAPANIPGSPNGVYHYGASAFPTDSYQSTNYWVDVIYRPYSATPTATPISIPVSTSVTPAPSSSPSTAPKPTASPVVTAVPVPAATPKPPVISGGDICASFPALPGYRPDASNTGVPAGANLTPSGSITAGSAGMVIDAKDISGYIAVDANNVTILNSRITSSAGELYGIKVKDGVTGTKIIHSEVFNPGGGYTGISMTDGIVCASHIHGWENGLTLGGNMIVQANYVHGAQGQPGSTPHYDAIELYSGSNVQIWGNNLLVNAPDGSWRGDTGALNITTEWSDINNVDANTNWFGGGSYSLYVRWSGGRSYRYSNITIRNNRWIRNSAAYGPVSLDDPVIWSGNVYDDNGAVVGQ